MKESNNGEQKYFDLTVTNEDGTKSVKRYLGKRKQKIEKITEGGNEITELWFLYNTKEDNQPVKQGWLTGGKWTIEDYTKPNQPKTKPQPQKGNLFTRLICGCFDNLDSAF